MTIFAVLAHGDPTTFNFLVESLAPWRMMVHVDAKTDIHDYARADHVNYVEDRVSVHWGGFSVVEATLRIYREAIRLAQDPDEYIVLLSGACVPLRPIQELDEFFRNSSGI